MHDKIEALQQSLTEAKSEAAAYKAKSEEIALMLKKAEAHAEVSSVHSSQLSISFLILLSVIYNLVPRT